MTDANMKDLAVSALAACIAQGLPDPDGTGYVFDPMKNQRAWQALGEIKRRLDTRTLPPINLPMMDPGLTETMVQALLSQGFEVALFAVVGQLKTVKQGPGSVIGWVPPENPFAFKNGNSAPVRCDKCKHSLASDARCHSINCECDCDGTDETGRHS